MKPWAKLGEAASPGGGTLTLWRRAHEYAIRLDGAELMTSRRTGSEEELARLALGRLSRAASRVLVGGLGMGFTLRSALDLLPPDGRVVVAEICPEVVTWNRGELGPLAGDPLRDPRALVDTRDVSAVIDEATGSFDAILLDVDNGPEGLSEGNDRLYSIAGLGAARDALASGGVLAVWSSGPAAGFERRMARCGFQVSVETARSGGPKGARHTIFVGVAPQVRAVRGRRGSTAGDRR